MRKAAMRKAAKIGTWFTFAFVLGMVLVSRSSAQTNTTPDLAVIVNPKNAVDSLSLNDLVKIYRGERQYWKGNFAHRSAVSPSRKLRAHDCFAGYFPDDGIAIQTILGVQDHACRSYGTPHRALLGRHDQRRRDGNTRGNRMYQRN